MPKVFNLSDIIYSFYEANQNLNPHPSIVVTIVVVVVVFYFLIFIYFFLKLISNSSKEGNSEEFNSLFGGHKCFEVDQRMAIFISIEIDI